MVVSGRLEKAKMTFNFIYHYTIKVPLVRLQQESLPPPFLSIEICPKNRGYRHREVHPERVFCQKAISEVCNYPTSKQLIVIKKARASFRAQHTTICLALFFELIWIPMKSHCSFPRVIRRKISQPFLIKGETLHSIYFL